ncbi:MAG: 4-hydroxythreonine-4-phosphate dehydrogenase PdxA [Tannerellaceae bacterium]|jgi:4-hydroxythreonine-4-phosphate dehydrogenase|nr:4-hydroxythreonine-4-phosphate dehydrogenase PdxA [Tannerellaceae bacterium]
MSADRTIKIGFTHGDINGISYELILKTFSDARMTELCTPVVYGSSKIAAYHRKALEMPLLNMSAVSRAEDAGAGRINMINCTNDEIKVELSKATDVAVNAAICSLEAAVKDLKRGAIQALVTTPVSSRLMNNDGYPSHSEYLSRHAGPNASPLTILSARALRIALLSEYVPLADALSQITFENLLDKLLVFDRSLKQDFRIVKPRIALLSPNPKAGQRWDNVEEQRVLIPVIEEASKRNLMCFGPYATDAIFGSQMYEKFDGIMAMYHDQGLTPFKTLFAGQGIYCTAGLPLIHTSPSHGAAYDIAGRNVASIDSFLQAIYAAIDIYRNRISYKEAGANPLRKQYFDKGSVDESVDLTREDDVSL